MEKKTRRNFIWLANMGIAALLILLWNKLTMKHIDLIGQVEKAIPYNKNKPITFFENYILVNQKDEITVLLAKCSHLGCKINSMENGKFICPCHGSEYDLEGKPIKGPAYKNLTKIPAQLSSDGLNVVIEH